MDRSAGEARLVDRGDQGLTIVELMVAMAIFSAVLGLILPTFLVLDHSATGTSAMTAEDTVSVPALRLLTSQVDNATTLYSPCAGAANTSTPACRGGSGGTPASGFALMMHFDPIGTGPTQGLCSQWRVWNGLLQDRIWDPLTAPSSLAFRTVTATSSSANGSIGSFPAGLTVTNSSSPAWQPPFTMEGTTGTKSSVVDVALWLQSSVTAPSQEVTTSAAAGGVTVSGEPRCLPPIAP